VNSLPGHREQGCVFGERPQGSVCLCVQAFLVGGQEWKEPGLGVQRLFQGHLFPGWPSFLSCKMVATAQLCSWGTLGGFPFLFFLFWWDQSLNSGLFTCKAGALLLEPCLQPILLWLFWRWGLVNYLPSLGLNPDLPDLSLPNRQGYSCEALHTATWVGWGGGHVRLLSPGGRCRCSRSP
jgi:hypothetical protein